MTETKAENNRQQTLPRIVIIGGGFAGLEAAKALKNAPVAITLLDRTNHHVFQPLLYQVATAALAPSEISSPIRYILRKQKNVQVLLSEVSSIDVENKIVYGDNDTLEFPYDYLLLATGTRHSYFGRDEWAQNAPGLKSISDALEIRKRFTVGASSTECWINTPVQLRTMIRRSGSSRTIPKRSAIGASPMRIRNNTCGQLRTMMRLSV